MIRSRRYLSPLPAAAGLCLALGLCVTMLAVLAPPALAVRITEEDPNGFHGIRWGAALAEVPDLTLVESSKRTQTYELKQGPPTLGEVAVDELRFVAIKGQFARVMVRYSGEETHKRVMAYLEEQFGPVDRTPGMMMRGLNQQFTWRGPETEVNLTYQGHQERGSLFIESRTLAPRFMDVLPEHAF